MSSAALPTRLLTSACFSYGFQLFNLVASQFFCVDNFTGFVEFSLPCLLLLNWSQRRHVLVSTLLLLWNLRLTIFLLYRMFVRDPRDTRLDKFREKGTNPYFWAVHGTWGFVCSFPVTVTGSIDSRTDLNGWDLVGVVVWLIGMILETTTDWIKLQAHVKAKKSWRYHFPIIDVYKFCRHPNFYGEFLIWIGIFIPTLNLESKFMLLCLASPILTLLIMLGEAVLLTEISNNKRFSSLQEYHQYKQRTSVFWPMSPSIYGHVPSWMKTIMFFELPWYKKKLKILDKDG